MRINTLDYLRGLMALGVMIYHYCSWTFEKYGSDTFIGIVGIYGVSIFYILSGLTLYYVYKKSLTLNTTPLFFGKRIFRILPLLGFSTVIMVVLFRQPHTIWDLFVNFTGLFGFVDHTNYIVTGAWSIGNELVFYAFLPIILLGNKWNKYFIEVFFLTTLAIAVYFAFELLEDTKTLAEQWATYINPFNQLFLFVGGILIGKIIQERKSNLLSGSLFAFCTLMILFYPVEGDSINIVSGWNRFVFSVVAFVITIAFLTFNGKVSKGVDWILSKLGHVSYSVYLTHAIVFRIVAQIISRTDNSPLFLAVSIASTIIFSWFTYHYFEVKFVELGKRVLTKKKVK